MSESVKQTICSTLHETFFTYTTGKVVKVPNTFIGILNRIIQLAIVAYIVIYIVWLKQGYQEFQEPRGTSIIKIKGIARVTGNNTTRYTRADSGHLWDTAEYQLPPLEDNAFFLATRQVFTYNQQEGKCPSALDDKLFCTNETALSKCPKDQPTPNTFGYFTGECVASMENPSVSVCQINAWCPEELADSTEFLLNSDDLDNFTVYLKTIVTFGLFNKKLRNVRADTNFTCRYNKDNDPYCPIYRIGDVLNNLGTNKATLLREGGLIEIRQDWTCDFDYNENRCYPELIFSVLQSGDDALSPGINYRYAQKYRINDTDYRTLSKVYGLRFVIAISGKGGQFNIVNLFIAIGSGIGFMVIAGIVCDAIFMYIHKSRERYRRGKFSVCEVSDKRSSLNENLTYEMPIYSTPNKIPTISDIYNESL